MKRNADGTFPKGLVPQNASHFHTRGGKRSKIYTCWRNMINRCRYKNIEKNRLYHAKGVQVCERWKVFENFLADMGEPPSPKHSLDRINNNGNYEPGNCRWTVSLVQANNTSKHRKFTFDGKTLNLSEWARLYGVTYHLVWKRIRRGWPIEQAVDPNTRRLRPGIRKKTG